MTQVTVEQLAKDVGATADRLLKQMKDAGLPHEEISDEVTEEQKQLLLAHLKRSHGDSDAGPRKITLKRKTQTTLKAGSGAVRGRTVSVETRKRRTYVRRGAPDDQEDAKNAAAGSAAATASSASEPPQIDEEVRRRAAIEAEAAEKRRREEARREAELKAKQEQEEEARRAAEQKAREEEEKRLAEEAAAAAAAQPEPVVEVAEPIEEAKPRSKTRRERDEEETSAEKPEKSKQKSRGERKARRVDLREALIDDDLESDAEAGKSSASKSTTLGLSGTRIRRKEKRHAFKRPTKSIVHEVEIGANISVGNLAQRMSVKAAEVIKVLMGLGVAANINQEIDQETAILVVEEMGHKARLLVEDSVEKKVEGLLVYDDAPEHRAPVVTVMGHVDHGKTSLLDYIRKSTVVTGEAGGITQHIGAYRVATDKGEICFIDTPGHAAFTAMRARGANSTDIVILVVAADDGVMPQTEEAIQHARAADVPVVVAMNKIDKEDIDVDRVKHELAAKELVPEEWGGDTQFIPVSAITGQGVDELLEAVLLQADVLELTAVSSGPAQGVVIEAQLDKGRGPVATLLVQNGRICRGDVVAAGQQFGRIRALQDENGKQVGDAGPSTPVSVLGLDGAPSAGDSFMVVQDEKKAREVAEFRRVKANEERLATQEAASLRNLFAGFGGTERKALNVVLKADVRGSLEAITSALLELGNAEVSVNVVSGGVGGITESDAHMALTVGAVMFGFNVRADSAAKRVIDAEGLDLRYYKVIYDIVDDVKAALTGMLSPDLREEIVGVAEVREVFQSKKFGQIAGCMVREGTVHRHKKIRVLRDNVVIYEGELESLRHFKDEVADVRHGTECGIGVRSYNDVRVGDQIEVFDTREVVREL